MLTNYPISYNTMEVGVHETSEQWACSLPDFDTIVVAYEQYFGWYSVDSPIGVLYAQHPARFGGAMIAGVEGESLERRHRDLKRNVLRLLMQRLISCLKLPQRRLSEHYVAWERVVATNLESST